MKLQLSSLYRRRGAGKPKAEEAPKRSRRGQSLVETALVLPFLILLLSVIIEAGLAINDWIRVNDAARDGARFAVDAGSASDVSGLVTSKLVGIDFGTSKLTVGSNNLNVYLIKGTTDATGHISAAAWTADTNHVYGAGGAATKLSKTTIENALAANGKNPNNVPFVIVEVDYLYTPLLGTLIAPNTKLAMSSYALIQQY